MLQGLLLDSGDTLMRPRGGRWNPRFDFEEVVARHVPNLPSERLGRALAAGDLYLRDWSEIEDRVGYTDARAGYHRAILRVLGVVDPTQALLEDLDRPLPFSEIVEPFADTAEGLARLHADGWRMAVVADTSPRLVEVYEHLGVAELIETFVISGDLGCAKPDPRMYLTATDRLGLDPAECVFVDDNPTNLDGARAVGCQVCGLARYGAPPVDGKPWVRDMAGLVVYLRELRSRPSTS